MGKLTPKNIMTCSAVPFYHWVNKLVCRPHGPMCSASAGGPPTQANVFIKCWWAAHTSQCVRQVLVGKQLKSRVCCMLSVYCNVTYPDRNGPSSIAKCMFISPCFQRSWLAGLSIDICQFINLHVPASSDHCS